MPYVKKINGYNVKDEEARDQIRELQTGKANASDVERLLQDNANLTQGLGEAKTQIAELQGGKANSSDVEELTQTMQEVNGTISELQSGKANVSDVEQLQQANAELSQSLEEVKTDVEELKTGGDLNEPNLLLNSDFRKVYNSRGQTSYSAKSWSSDVPCINRWFLKGLATTLNVNDDSVTLSVTSETGHLRQAITLPNGTYTATVKVRSLTGTVKCYVDTEEEYTLTTGKNVCQFTGEPKFFNIYCTAGSSVELEWIHYQEGTDSVNEIEEPKMTAEMLALISLLG